MKNIIRSIGIVRIIFNKEWCNDAFKIKKDVTIQSLL